MIITYSEFVYEEIQHATRMLHIVISDFSGCRLYKCLHIKRHDFKKKKFLNVKYVL